MPRHKNQVNFDPATKTKSFSTPTQKISQFPSLLWNQVSFDPPYYNQVHFDHAHKKQVNFDAHTKTESFSTRTQKWSQFRPPTQKPSQFRALHWNQVNFDLLHQNQVNFDHPHKKQVNFDAPTKAKSFWNEPVDARRRSPVGAPPAPRPWPWTDDQTPEPCKRCISSGSSTDSSLTSHLVVLQPRRYPPVNNPLRA